MRSGVAARRDDLQARRGGEQLADRAPPPAARCSKLSSTISVGASPRRSAIVCRRAAGPAPRGRRARRRSRSRRGSGPAPARGRRSTPPSNVLAQRRRGLEREARLARAAEPGQRDEPRGGLLEQRRRPRRARRRGRRAASRSTGRFDVAAGGGRRRRRRASVRADRPPIGRAAERRARGLDHLAARRVALLGLLRHRARDHRVERLGQVGADLGDLRRRLGDVGEHHRDVGVALVRLLAGQRLVEHAAEGVDVRGGRDLLRLDLLGRGVVDRADEDARPASARARRRRLLRDAEVHQVDPPGAVLDHHVRAASRRGG